MSEATRITDKIVKVLVYDVAVELACKAAIAKLPFLGLPVVRQVFEFLVGQIGDIVYEQLSKFAILTVIRFEVEADRVKYERAVRDLDAAIQSGERNEIENKKIEFKARLRELVRLDP